MLDFSQMLTRLVVALILGALIGLEREIVGKEAGVRTGMLVAAGAAIFTMIGLLLPSIIAPSPNQIADITAHSGALGVIANIVVGVGFLGAGIIIKTHEHVKGLTTAAVVWTTAAIGTAVGLGLTQFAAATTIIIAVLLYVLRALSIKQSGKEK